MQGQVAAEVRVRFQIDVENLQISFEGETSGGRFLLAAEHSNVVGFELGSEVNPGAIFQGPGFPPIDEPTSVD